MILKPNYIFINSNASINEQITSIMKNMKYNHFNLVMDEP